MVPNPSQNAVRPPQGNTLYPVNAGPGGNGGNGGNYGNDGNSGNSGNNENNLVWNLLHGRNCRICKRAYDRLIAATGMTYEQLFKLRDGFEEEDDG
jgi:hypothetical protein